MDVWMNIAGRRTTDSLQPARRWWGACFENSPTAMAETKATALESAWGSLDRDTFDALVDAHARKRQTAEAAEGLASFAEKRSARWKRG
jgi:methylglutaconyl-CoA hydratase